MTTGRGSSTCPRAAGCSSRLRGIEAICTREAAACAANKARHDDLNAKRVMALTKVATPFGERVLCDERTGEPQPLSIDREGKFALTAKPFCDSLKLEIEVSPDLAARIAALLAAL